MLKCILSRLFLNFGILMEHRSVCLYLIYKTCFTVSMIGPYCRDLKTWNLLTLDSDNKPSSLRLRFSFRMTRTSHDQGYTEKNKTKNQNFILLLYWNTIIYHLYCKNLYSDTLEINLIVLGVYLCKIVIEIMAQADIEMHFMYIKVRTTES